MCQQFKKNNKMNTLVIKGELLSGRVDQTVPFFDKIGCLDTILILLSCWSISSLIYTSEKVVESCIRTLSFNNLHINIFYIRNNLID